MKTIIPICLASIALGSMLHGQTAAQSKSKCALQLVRPTTNPDRVPTKAASYEGYKRSPIFTFEVDESGTVQHVKIKRSSGSITADELALDWVRHWQYKPGCGIVESEAMVIIDFAAQ